MEWLRNGFRGFKDWVYRQLPKQTSEDTKGTLPEQTSEDTKGLYFCQRDEEDKQFENFCTLYLPKCRVQKLKKGQTIPGPLFLVLNIPPVNRQDNVKVISKSIDDIYRLFNIEEYSEVILVQISFDGNFSSNPPNMMDDVLFEKLEIAVARKFNSYINIVYADGYDYTNSPFNMESAERLNNMCINNS